MARLKWELHIGFVQHPQLLNSFLSSKKKYRIHTQIHSRQKHVCVDHWVLQEGERGEEEIPASGFKALTWMPFIIELCLWMEDQEGSCCLSIGLMLLTDDSWHAFHCRGCLSVGFRVQARRLLGTIYGGGGLPTHMRRENESQPSLSPHLLPPKEETGPELSLARAVTSTGLTPWPLPLAGGCFTGDFSLSLFQLTLHISRSIWHLIF